MEFVIRTANPRAHVINLVADAPRCNPTASSYLLASLCKFFPVDSVFLCVVDPGVGGARLPIVLKADGRWFVGPNNSLLNTVACHAMVAEWWIIEWRPKDLSASFHGRDLFAPIAAQIDHGGNLSGLKSWCGPNLSAWHGDIDEIIYVDHYGNLMTGRRFICEYDGKKLFIDKHSIPQSNTFGAVPVGQPLWYKDSIGLIEIAVNQNRADEYLGVEIGDHLRFQ